MDDQRFDRLTRTIAGASTRRATLRHLAGGALAGLLALRGVEEAAACRGFKATCKDSSQCCGDPGFRCRSGVCRCGRTQKYCSPSGDAKAGACIPKDTCCPPAGGCTNGLVCPGVGQQCCIPEGFGDESICDNRDDTRCCAGSACREINVGNGFRCRPEGCVEKGQNCQGAPAGCPTACCSQTSNGQTCL